MSEETIPPDNEVTVNYDAKDFETKEKVKEEDRLKYRQSLWLWCLIFSLIGFISGFFLGKYYESSSTKEFIKANPKQFIMTRMTGYYLQKNMFVNLSLAGSTNEVRLEKATVFIFP